MRRFAPLRFAILSCAGAEVCPAEDRPVQVRAGKFCVTEVRLVEKGPAEVCLCEVCEGRLAEVGPVEVHPGEMCLAKVGSAKVSIAKVRAGEALGSENDGSVPFIPSVDTLLDASELFCIAISG